MKLFVVVVLCVLACCCSALHTPEEWKSRIIYQLLTDRFANPNNPSSKCRYARVLLTSISSDLHNYCGGTFEGVRQKLDYIASLGANAIWISPVVTNADGAYHGYHARNLYTINSHFGSSQDLKDLVADCHKREIWVMLDIVGNHMGPLNDFSQLIPFNSTDHYHFPRCDISDWSNQQQVENCWLSGLPDLKQENTYVANELISWLQYMTETYNFDGYRLDTVCEVPKTYWQRFQKEGANGALILGEIFNGNVDYVASYQGALTSVLSYPMFFVLRNVFAYKHSMYELNNEMLLEPSKYKDPSVLGVFIDNHDNKRFLNINKDWVQYYNALIYMFASRGIPIVYYGAEEAFSGGDDPNNRESLWPNYNTNHTMFNMIRTLSDVRTKYGLAYESSMDSLWVNDQVLVIGRGSKAIVVLSNIGSGNQYQINDITIYKMKEGTKLCDIFNRSNSVIITNSMISVTVTNGVGTIYVPC